MQVTNQDRFRRFCENVRTSSYQNDARKLREFNDAIAYINAHVQEYLENGLTASYNGIVVVVNYNESQGLRVTHVRSGAVATGYVRQLKDLIEQITPNDNPRYCETCRRNHKTLGLEIEFKALGSGRHHSYDGNVYRSALLMKLNNKARINPDADDYGIDGSSVPIELRNMNGNTSAEIAEILKERLGKFMEAFEFMKANFPGVPSEIETTECGIHVHAFHKGIARDRILSAHSLVGVVVNSLAMVDWNSRIPRGYGIPYASRGISHDSRAPWCRNDINATELRTFGVMRPEVLKFALDQTSMLLNNPNNINTATAQEWGRYLQTANIPGVRMTNAEGLKKTLQFFIDHGTVTIDQLVAMIEWLNENYIPFHAGQTVTRVITLDMVRGLRARNIQVQVPAPVRTRRDSRIDREIRQTIRRGEQFTPAQVHEVRQRLAEVTTPASAPVEPTEEIPESASIWCTRIATAHRNPRQFHPVLMENGQPVRHFRNSIRRHIDLCPDCHSLLSGYALRSTQALRWNGQEIGGFGFFDRQRASA